MKNKEIRDNLLIEIDHNYSKIKLFRRIFGWQDIMLNIKKDIQSMSFDEEVSDSSNVISELKSQYENQIQELKHTIEKQELEAKKDIKNWEDKFSSQSRETNNEIKHKRDLESKIELLNQELKNQKELTVKEIENKQSQIEIKEKQINEINNKLTKRDSEAKKDIRNLEDKIAEQLNEIRKESNKKNELQKTVELLKQDLSNQKELSSKEIASKQALIDAKENQIKDINTNFVKLNTEINKSNEEIKNKTTKIYDVFSNSSGSRGKLAEIRLENVLNSYFGPEGDHWVTNLKTGGGSERVEFGVRVNITDTKWVPVDSKALIPKEVNEDGEYLFDKKYISSIKIQAEKIAKLYVGNENTTDYALLVLPSDDFFIKVHEEFGKEIEEISKTKVYVTSPNSFTQFINTISQLQGKMEIAKKT